MRIRDDRIRRPLSRPVIVYRMILRFYWASFLFFISLGGFALWLPVAVTTFYAVHNFKKTGPVWDTWDEIAQYKLIYGLVSGLCVSPERLSRLRATRADLHRRVVHLAVDGLGLPADPERHFVVCGEKDKGRVVGRWANETNYFSVRRRRKRDWNETLRLYEQFDYPSENS